MIKTKWRKKALVPFAALAAVTMLASATGSTMASVASAAKSFGQIAPLLNFFKKG